MEKMESQRWRGFDEGRCNTVRCSAGGMDLGRVCQERHVIEWIDRARRRGQDLLTREKDASAAARELAIVGDLR